MTKKGKGIAVVPDHVALIPDGNRRWSKANRTRMFEAYNLGIKKFVDFSVWLKGFGVKNLTVWALSMDNVLKRQNSELSVLYGLYVKAARDPEIMEKLKENGARIRVIGRLDLLPRTVREALESVERKTKSYTDFTINLLVAYGGRYDLLSAVNSSRASIGDRQLTEEDLKGQLLTSSIPDADMIIRTSGETRLSGFLPWQSSYSELYFSRKYWPDFSKRDLRRALVAFSSRQRRFGK
jgi:undecaprenyl diphosphate synthase